jgi:hypothetical protein
MRIVDTSVLLPAVSPSAAHHAVGRAALEDAINGGRPLGLTWGVVNAFLRLTTKPGLFERPLTIDEAWDLVDAWRDHPNVRILQETEEHARLWSDLLRSAGVAGDLTTDAWIAAIALGHGASVLTLDPDFARFPRVRWENPLSR